MGLQGTASWQLVLSSIPTCLFLTGNDAEPSTLFRVVDQDATKLTVQSTL